MSLARGMLAFAAGGSMACVAVALAGRWITGSRSRLIVRAAALAAGFAPGYLQLDGSAPPEIVPAWLMLYAGLTNPRMPTVENPAGFVGAAVRLDYLRGGAISLTLSWLIFAGIGVAFLRRRRAAPSA